MDSSSDRERDTSEDPTDNMERLRDRIREDVDVAARQRTIEEELADTDWSEDELLTALDQLEKVVTTVNDEAFDAYTMVHAPRALEGLREVRSVLTHVTEEVDPFE